MYQLICTSYNETEQGLVLRNNWTEEVLNDKQMFNLIELVYKASIINIK